jgi:hypothetical protein
MSLEKFPTVESASIGEIRSTVRAKLGQRVGSTASSIGGERRCPSLVHAIKPQSDFRVKRS